MKTMLIVIAFFISLIACAADDQLIQNIHASGTCELANITPAQAQHIALNNARQSAIEKATGVRITSSSIVSNGHMSADYVKATTIGYIVNEKQMWHDVQQYMNNGKVTLLYTVDVVVDVYVPHNRQKSPLVLDFPETVISGNKAILKIQAAADVNIAIFNVSADDNIVMLSPYDGGEYLHLKSGESISYPDDRLHYDMIMTNTANHKEDSELFIVLAWSAQDSLPVKEIFGYTSEPLIDFYRKYAEICDKATDTMIAYNIVSPLR